MEVGPDGAPNGLGVFAVGQSLDDRAAAEPLDDLGLGPGPCIGGTEMAIHPVPELRQSHACPLSSFGGGPQPPCWVGCWPYGEPCCG